jgi:hypothetical protein
MNAAILKCVNDLTKSANVTATGIHPVNFNLQITDNNTGEVTDAHYVGTVSKADDQMIAATATIPWIQVVGRMAIALGATQANVVNLLKDCILDAVQSGDNLSEALAELDIRIAGTVDKVKKELVGSMPKIPRTGATKVAVTEVVDIETMTTGVTDGSIAVTA